MNALIFKRYLELIHNKIRLISFFILPIICFLLTIYFDVPIKKIAIYCPLYVSLLHVFVFWNQENIVLSSNLIFTPLTAKRIWLINAIFSAIGYYIYCYLIFVISICIYCRFFNLFIPFLYLFYGALNVVPAIGITVFSTLSNIENKLIKQWIASLGSLFNMFSFVFFLCLHHYFPVTTKVVVFLNIIGIILFIFALILNIKIDNEKILCFSDNIYIIGGNGLVE